jgi:hypothetical protein
VEIQDAEGVIGRQFAVRGVKEGQQLTPAVSSGASGGLPWPREPRVTRMLRWF